ncbi:MAG TPA: M23 family metallopeptidase [Chitinophagaceae bacterium]|jgi:murein DD-endopeptidase MepM/ murein hydrolase activator NlpD|nr:M23 family metallopeptidase [Chitinophagaceae bacterium]
MKYTVFLLLLAALTGTSCSTVSGLFRKKTPHEQYASRLDHKDLDRTPEGRQWLAAAAAALTQAQPVALPYRQQGYFHPGKPRALGLRFTARRGERISFTVDKKAAGFTLYADLYRIDDNGNDHLLSADTTQNTFYADIAEAGTYVLRLQPRLFTSGAYTLSASVGPSLHFPVDGKANIGSFWGASRGGGSRSHEGIDIFAKKGTPVVAVADGFIIGVREGGLGGKVVWLRPADKSIHVYYAHLDEQLVKEGQVVKKGDVLGTVGNTGNARTTPAHLHFGVYVNGTAVDPLPFVDRTIKTAPALASRNLNSTLRLTKSQRTPSGSVIQANTLLVPIALTSKGYIAELPDGSLIQVSTDVVKTI